MDAGQIAAWDHQGRLVAMDKLEVHRRGLRHPAVSVFVLWGDQLLLQRRAAGKYHTPGLWANACCTHPHWGEGPLDCALRRLREELGIEGLALQDRGEVHYRADVGAGLTEDEVVRLFVARVDRPVPMRPDPAEVAEVRWLALAALKAEMAARPQAFTPWLQIYLAQHPQQILGQAPF